MTTPFLQARTAFEQRAAAVLAPLGSPLQILPLREDVVGFQAYAVGTFTAFEAQKLEGTELHARLRGWAQPGGEVALLEPLSLGPLFQAGLPADVPASGQSSGQASGPAAETSSLSAEQWATRLVWAQGPACTLVLKPTHLPPDTEFSPTFLPKLERSSTGAWTLAYVYTRAETKGAGIVLIFQRVVQISSSYQVSIQDTRLKL